MPHETRTRGANAVRGEASAVLAGVERTLCLTLGALAEIETALGVKDLGELVERMRRPTARDLMAVLAALLRGGGEKELAGTLDRSAVTPGEAAEAVTRAFEASAGRAGG